MACKTTWPAKCNKNFFHDFIHGAESFATKNHFAPVATAHHLSLSLSLSYDQIWPFNLFLFPFHHWFRPVAFFAIVVVARRLENRVAVFDR
jgi:hypothetical protein